MIRLLSLLLTHLPLDALPGTDLPTVVVAGYVASSALDAASRFVRWVLDADERTDRLVHLIKATRRRPR